jgi:Flp pilus assembly protein TadD
MAMRAVLVVASLVALWAIFVPLGTTTAVRASQQATGQGRLLQALRDAADAQQLEPSAATPRLQRALVLEQLGDVSGAAQAIQGAVRRSPTDWALWLVASRIATEQNRPALALRDYRQARTLNPRSPIFGG